MNETASGFDTARGGRGLAQIEDDLHEAEKFLVEADARLEAAKRERAAAVEKINQYQNEFDRIVADRRRQSIPGTKWHQESGEARDPLDLGTEGMALRSDQSVDSPAFKVVSGQFDRLRDHVASAEPDSE